MVYRLVPSYRFSHQSHFGMEDMSKTPVVASALVGLVVGVVLSWVLESHALKADPSDKLYKTFVQMDSKGKPTVFKNWQFWLVAVSLCLVCSAVGASVGAAIVHSQSA